MEQSDLSDGVATTGIEAFRDAQLPRVRAYVAVVCSPERSDEAGSAALVDLLARTGGEPAPATQLERELLRATRSAAAGRFNVVVPIGRPEFQLTPECQAMPELLALHANGERPEDEVLIAGHPASCAACAHTLDRMREAERAFARGVGELPTLEAEETIVDTSKARAAPTPLRPGGPNPVPGGSNPVPQPELSLARGSRPYDPPAAPGAPVATHRRRSGGLVGAIRKLGRPTRG